MKTKYFFKVGLKHGLLIRPRESEMIVIMEDVYDQILKQNILKDDHIYRHRAQTSLKALTTIWIWTSNSCSMTGRKLKLYKM